MKKIGLCASVLQCLAGMRFNSSFVLHQSAILSFISQRRSFSGPDGMWRDKIRTYMHLSLARQERDVLSYSVTLLGLINVFLAKGILLRTTYHMGKKAYLHIIEIYALLKPMQNPFPVSASLWRFVLFFILFYIHEGNMAIKKSSIFQQLVVKPLKLCLWDV